MRSKMASLALSTIFVAILIFFINATDGRATSQVDLGRVAAPVASLGTAFTYQGYLESSGSPVNDTCDLQFKLWDALNGGAQVGQTQTSTNVAVNGGLFTVQLDFGSAFDGDTRWLEIAARCPAGSGSYTTLSPRQALTAAPYALYSLNAPWSGLSGVPAGFADGVDNDTTTFWSLTGNPGTTPGTNFLGTTDDQALELRVNSQRALRLEPAAGSPNLIGGYSGNSALSGVKGATIGGGGEEGSNYTNLVTDDYGTVSGGVANLAGDVSGTMNDAGLATVGGGSGNRASGLGATVGGGQQNEATDSEATVGGGFFNEATNFRSTVGGGAVNEASGRFATISGGAGNTASGENDSVGGGWDNAASNGNATVAGGAMNTAWGHGSAVGGGVSNVITTTAQFAAIPGGRNNFAQGSYSFAAGRRANANHAGTFVWADANDYDFSTFADNGFKVRATGGVRIVVGIDETAPGPETVPTWQCTFSNGSSWTCSSSRSLKENLTPVDGRETLERLRGVPIYRWNGKGQDPAVTHFGPTSEDFYTAFGVGEDASAIATIDLDGVALAAIQGLYELAQEKDAQIATLQQQVAELQQHNASLEARLTALEQAVGVEGAPSQPPASDLPAAPIFFGGLFVVTLVLAQRWHAGGRS